MTDKTRDDRKLAHVFVSGHVQGVFFRESARQEAERLGVSGWVRNLPDGRVEAVFEGDADAVKRMAEWCAKGPPAARVDNVSVGYERPQSATGFEVR